jgi:catalase (peroxidase I)
MDFRSGAGGSDGCLRFDDPENKGLVNCLNGDFNMDGDTDPDAVNKTLHGVYRNFCDIVSLTDFMVIAGEAVRGFLETAINLKQDVQNLFLYGRTTSATCANAVALPNPFHGCSANEVTFLASDAFGMTWRQTAAIMGVHTIGKTTLQNSGYNGWWQYEYNVARFNNNYYISIANHGWGPAVQTSGKSRWAREDTNGDQSNLHPEMMLNTDMCLV